MHQIGRKAMDGNHIGILPNVASSANHKISQIFQFFRILKKGIERIKMNYFSEIDSFLVISADGRK